MSFSIWRPPAPSSISRVAADLVGGVAMAGRAVAGYGGEAISLPIPCTAMYEVNLHFHVRKLDKITQELTKSSITAASYHGSPLQNVSAEEHSDSVSYRFRWQYGVSKLTTTNPCHWMSQHPPNLDLLTVTGTDAKGRAMRATGAGAFHLLREVRPDQQVCCFDDHGRPKVTTWDFHYFVLPTEVCEGSYQAELRVRVVGGHLTAGQVPKELADVGAIETNEDGEVDLGKGTFVPEKGSDSFLLTWPSQSRRCGHYWVTLNVGRGNFPIFIDPPQKLATIDTNQQAVRVPFEGVMDLSAGGGGTPKRPGEQGRQSPMPSAPTPSPSSEPDAFVEDEAPITVPPLDEAELPAPNAGAVSIESAEEPAAEVGSVSSEPFNQGVDADSGPPWTLMDLVVNPIGSVEARQVLEAHRIDGAGVLRGDLRPGRMTFDFLSSKTSASLA